MKPIEFTEQNGVLAKPPTMTDEQCRPLPVFRDGVNVISCWSATWRERLRFLRTGRMYLGVLSGNTQPPVFLSTTRPFK